MTYNQIPGILLNCRKIYIYFPLIFIIKPQYNVADIQLCFYNDAKLKQVPEEKGIYQ